MAAKEHSAADYAALIQEYLEKMEMSLVEAESSGLGFWIDFRADQPWITMEHGSAVVQIGLFGDVTLRYAAPVPAVDELRLECLEKINHLNINWHGQASWAMDAAGDGWLLRAQSVFHMDACSRSSARACAGEIRQSLAMIVRQVKQLGDEMPDLFGSEAMIGADMMLPNLDDCIFLRLPSADREESAAPEFDERKPESEFHALDSADYALMVRATAFGADALSEDEKAQLARAMDLSILRGDENFADLRAQLGGEIAPVEEGFDPFSADPDFPQWLPEWGDENALLERHERGEELSGWELILLNEASGRQLRRSMQKYAFTLRLKHDVDSELSDDALSTFSDPMDDLPLALHAQRVGVENLSKEEKDRLRDAADFSHLIVDDDFNRLPHPMDGLFARLEEEDDPNFCKE